MVYVGGSLPPISSEVRVVVSYRTDTGSLRAIERTGQLPAKMLLRSCPPENATTFTTILKRNEPLVGLAQLFPGKFPGNSGDQLGPEFSGSASRVASPPPPRPASRRTVPLVRNYGSRNYDRWNRDVWARLGSPGPVRDGPPNTIIEPEAPPSPAAISSSFFGRPTRAPRRTWPILRRVIYRRGEHARRSFSLT